MRSQYGSLYFFFDLHYLGRDRVVVYSANGVISDTISSDAKYITFVIVDGVNNPFSWGFLVE